MTLAYFDSFAGLVPCRIVAVGDWDNKFSDARVQFTATRGPWKKGEFYTALLCRIVPRKAVSVRNGQYRIRAYKWSDHRSNNHG